MAPAAGGFLGDVIEGHVGCGVSTISTAYSSIVQRFRIKIVVYPISL